MFHSPKPQAARANAAFATLPPHGRMARVQHACAAALVAGSALMPGGMFPGSWESRVHEQVDQLLRVFNRLGRLKATDRALQAAERIRRAQVHCHGRQPSELRFAADKPPLARAASDARSFADS